MLQRVIQKIGGGLLPFLVVKTKCGNRWIKGSLKPHTFALKGFGPPLRQLFEAIPQVIIAKLQNQFAALQRGIIKEHGDQAHQAFAAIFRFI